MFLRCFLCFRLGLLSLFLLWVIFKDYTRLGCFLRNIRTKVKIVDKLWVRLSVSGLGRVREVCVLGYVKFR